MKEYTSIKPGSKLSLSYKGFAYNRDTKKQDDTSKVWCRINNPNSDADPEDTWMNLIATGYVDNIFGATVENDADQTGIEITVTKCCFMEHMNGGRKNDNEYATVEDYLADPVVKENARKHVLGGIFDRGPGDSDKLDFVFEFKVTDERYVSDKVFTMSESLWDEVLPSEWYNEFHSDTIADLSGYKVYESAEAALAAVEVREDLFGNRLFPVIKAPLSLKDLMVEYAGNCKGHSTPIDDGESVYIGLRCKEWEISVVNEVYESGGAILQNREWNW